MKLPIKYRDVTWQERRTARNEYSSIQNGKCWYCDQPLDGEARKDIRDKPINKRLFPRTFFDHPVHLHHCHKSGLTIGSVHNQCNAVLWQHEGK